MNEKVEEIITVSLTKEQLKNLDRYYLDDIFEYSALIKRYNKEKATNNNITALREWTPSYRPTLTSADKANVWLVPQIKYKNLKY